MEPDLAPHLPDPRQGRAIADKLVREHRLLPDTAPPFSVEPGTIGGTHAAILDARKKVRTTRQLDVQVSYAMGVSVLPDDGSSAVRVPMVGGGGEFTVTLGDSGRLIGFDGVWRPLEAVGFDAEAIPPAEADDGFRKLMSGLDVRSFTSYLAYYAAPASREQEFPYPCTVSGHRRDRGPGGAAPDRHTAGHDLRPAARRAGAPAAAGQPDRGIATHGDSGAGAGSPRWPPRGRVTPSRRARRGSG